MFPELSPAEVELIVGEVKAAVTVNAMAEMETESRQVLATL
jgi:hypothetical protein